MDLSVYERTIQPRKSGKRQDLFELVKNKDYAGMRKWFKTHLAGKEFDRQYHVLMRDLAVKKCNQAKKEYDEVLKREFKKQLDRDYLSVGKDVPTMVKGEFSKSVNKKLVHIKETADKYFAIACAHHVMVVFM